MKHARAAKTKVQRQSDKRLLARVTAEMKQPREAESVRVEEQKQTMGGSKEQGMTTTVSRELKQSPGKLRFAGGLTQVTPSAVPHPYL
jgi:hypothetical protein